MDARDCNFLPLLLFLTHDTAIYCNSASSGWQNSLQPNKNRRNSQANRWLVPVPCRKLK